MPLHWLYKATKRLNQKKTETLELESGRFLKEVNEEEYKNQAQLNITTHNT